MKYAFLFCSIILMVILTVGCESESKGIVNPISIPVVEPDPNEDTLVRDTEIAAAKVPFYVARKLEIPINSIYVLEYPKQITVEGNTFTISGWMVVFSGIPSMWEYTCQMLKINEKPDFGLVNLDLISYSSPPIELSIPKRY